MPLAPTMSTSKVQLFFREMAQIAGSEGLSVVVLSDSAGCWALTIVCDEPMTQQLLIRFNHLPGEQQMLPEVLTKLLFQTTDTSAADYELLTYDVDDGQYKTMLISRTTGISFPVRMSDALLLSTLSKIPLFIEEQLFCRQRSLFSPHTSGLVIPINTISIDRLREELRKAIAEENYRLASSLHEEIKKRTKQ